MACKTDGNATATEKFLRSLKAEVERLAEQAGAEIIDISEGESADGHLADFEISYGIGNANGKFEAHVEPVIVKPDKPGASGGQFRVRIEEWAG